MVEQIKDGDEVLGIIIRAHFQRDGIQFFTPDQFSQQLAYMRHPAGRKIDAHYHTALPRSVEFTQEVLVIRKGVLRTDFYRRDQSYLESRVLREGDVMLLAHGGHGFEVLEDLEMIEVKQGPYAGEKEKVRFASAPASELRIVA